jgi:hypothetical protein
LTVLSSLPEAKYLLSGEKATEWTYELSPIKSGYLPYFKFLKSVSTNSQLFILASVIIQLSIFVLVNLPLKILFIKFLMIIIVMGFKIYAIIIHFFNI